MAAPLPGQNVRASDMFNLASFTPSWSGLSVGSGASNEGWYNVAGDIVTWGVRLQLGSSPSASSTIQVDLPVPAWVGGGNSLQAVLGTASYRDSSATAFYTGVATVWASAGTQACFLFAGSTTRYNATVPVAPGVDDVISVTGVYRAQ